MAKKQSDQRQNWRRKYKRAKEGRGYVIQVAPVTKRKYILKNDGRQVFQHVDEDGEVITEIRRKG